MDGPSPGTYLWQAIRIYLFCAVPAALTLSQPPCCHISCLFSRIQMCWLTLPSIQQLHFSHLLLQLNFFTPLPSVKGGKHYKRSHIRFVAFSHKKMHKNRCLPQLFSFTILISWNKSTKNLQVYCFLHEDRTVNICIYFAAKPVFSVTECEY